MKSNSYPCTVAAILSLSLPGFLLGAAATSDLTPPTRRQTSVETAERLTRPPTPAPVPADLPQPFNPAGFDQPDPEELKGNPAAGTPATNPAGPGVPAQPAQPAGPAGDRETLEALAARLIPSGSVILAGKPRLIIGTNRFEVGTKFGVVYNNQDYELELVAIDRTTFTLRYRGEEITRPIKPVR